MDDATGTYTGNGTTQAIVLGFVPTTVRFFNTQSRHTAIWESPLTDGQLLSQESGDDVLVTEEGVTLTGDGFSVGSLALINGNGADINYEAEDDTPDE